MPASAKRPDPQDVVSGETSVTARRSARLEARLAVAQLDAIRHAAALEGCSLSEFVVAAAGEVARETLSRAHAVELTVADQRRFADAPTNPPVPNAAMRGAARRHAALEAD